MTTPKAPTTPLLQPSDVIYAPGWDYCYQIVSGAFCRIHYLHWQGRLASAPSDPQIYWSYLIQPLGGSSISRILVKASHFVPR